MISPTHHQFFFLLGLESEWGGRAAGSSFADFGGKRDLRPNGEPETAAQTAARELAEESLGLVKCPTAQQLEDGSYCLRLGFLAQRRTIISIYESFVVQVPFDPLICARFAARRREGVRQGAPAVTLEKHRLELFSAPRLWQMLKKRPGAPKLRKSFVSRMRTALVQLGQGDGNDNDK